MATSVSATIDADFPALYENLADSLARGEVAFLIGAGMSLDGGIDPGTVMAGRMLRRAVLGAGHEDDPKGKAAYDTLASKYPFEGIAEYLVEEHPQHDIATW